MDTRWVNWWYRAAAVALLCSVSDVQADAPAKPFAPRGSISAVLHSPDSVDAMSIHCLPTDPASTDLAEVNCEFAQLLVTKKPPPSSADVQALEKGLRERLSEPGKLKKVLAQCRESAKFFAEVREVLTEPHKLASVDRERAALDAFCACKTVDCAVAARVAELTAKATNACDVTHTRFEQTFKRQSPTQWVSVSGPAGMCDIVLTLVIEYNASEDSWSYTQKRVVTSTRPDCQGFESTTRAYSHHRYLRNAIMNCEVINTLLP